MKKHCFSLILFIFLSALPASPASADTQTAGRVIDITGNIKAVDAQGQKRKITMGSPLHMGDQITTGREEWLKLKFEDETLFTIGEKSEITIDEFVYLPADSNNKMNLAVKGSFRFLTGKMVKQKPESFRVNTSYAHIGVRGTQVAGNISKKKAFIVLEKPSDPKHDSGHAFLSATVNGRIEETHLTRFGFGSVVKIGEAPSPAFQVEEKDLKKITEKLEKPKNKSLLNPIDAFDTLADFTGIKDDSIIPDPPDGNDLHTNHGPPPQHHRDE